MATAELKAVITAEDRASKVLKGLGGSFSTLAGAVGVGNIASQAFTKSLDLLVNAGKSAITQAASFEQTRIGLENMLGSADKARILLKDISKFAADTPFEFPELAQATRQLVAFGFGAEDAFVTMKQLGDVSAAVGAPINDLAYLMGTLKTQGRAFTVDIRQFAQRGIPIYEYLAKVLHTNTNELSSMIEQGKIGFPQVQEAFKLMTAEGGKFHGTMAKQSKSLNGLWSTLKDNISAAGRALVGITDQGDVLEGGVFDRLRDSVAGFVDVLPRAMESTKAFWNESLMPVIRSIIDLATQVYNFLLPSLTALWNTVETEVYPTLKRLYEEVIVPLAPLIGSALVAGIWLLINALNVWLNIWDTIYNIGINLFTFLTITLPNGIKTAFDFIVQKAIWLKDNFWIIIGSILGFMITLPTMMPIYVAEAIAKIISIIASVKWSDVFAGIWWAMQGVWDKITNIVVKAWQYIHDLKWSDIFVNVGKGLANAVIDVVNGAINSAFSNVPVLKDHIPRIPHFAEGTNYAPGGAAIVGENGPEIVNLPRGSQVIPNDRINQSGATQNFVVNIGMYAGTEMEKRKIAQSLMRAYQDATGV